MSRYDSELIHFADFDPPPGVSRRDFFRVLGGGIVITFSASDLIALQQRRRRRAQRLPDDFNAFLKIAENGRVMCFTGKIEMGQGIVTSLAQMLADELEVSLEVVDMTMGDTDLCPWDMGTFGSMTTRFFGPPLRAAAAEAREVLLELASDHLEVPRERLAVTNGMISDTTDSSESVSYAEIAKGKKIARRLSHKAVLESFEDFSIVGMPVNRRDGVAKVTGAARYAGDIRRDGMLYAAILRPPAHGAKLLGADVKKVSAVDGVELVQDRDLVAVLHQLPDEAARALELIEAKWEIPESELDENTIFSHLETVAPEMEVSDSAGDISEGRATAQTTLDLAYQDGYVAHAPIETHTALAAVDGAKVTIWASTQTPFRLRTEAAEALGLPERNVRVVPPFVGGGFGGKTANQQAVEAARLSKLCGKPVQVAWTRAEEFFFDHFRPAAVVKIKAGLTAQKRIAFWDYRVLFAGQRGADHPYDIAHSRTGVAPSGWRGARGTHPFATGAWRAPGNNTNTFARESAIDELAHEAGIDPIAFRLEHLRGKPMSRVLEAAAKRAGWPEVRLGKGRGRGVACGSDAGTDVALIAEVTVDSETGHVKIDRVVCAQNMGLVINPQGATIQMEGCIMMGLGYALTEELRFRGGQVLDTNFDTYEIPRFSWLPEIETEILDNPGSPPQGGGEPAIIVVGGAIANAVFDAVGARVRRLPLTPDRVKGAIPQNRPSKS